jgi:hypothetical protein
MASALTAALVLAGACQCPSSDRGAEPAPASTAPEPADLFPRLERLENEHGLIWPGTIASVRDIPRPWTVEKLLAEYAVALEAGRRGTLICLLAASRDRRGLIVAGRALDDGSVRFAAAWSIVNFWVGRPVIGGAQVRIHAARMYWEEHRAELEAEEKRRQAHR